MKSSITINTDVNRLPEEKVPLAIVPAVERLNASKQKQLNGTAMDVHKLHSQNSKNTFPNKSNKDSTTLIPQNENNGVKQELAEIAQILTNSILLAQEQNPLLGEINTYEFNELKALNVMTSGMVNFFSSSDSGELISQMNRAKAHIASIHLYCQNKNFNPKALNIIKQCTERIIALKVYEELDVLTNENSNHRNKFQNRFIKQNGVAR